MDPDIGLPERWHEVTPITVPVERPDEPYTEPTKTPEKVPAGKLQ